MKSKIISIILGIGLMLHFSYADTKVILHEDEIFLIVKGQKAECVGVAPMECLQVKYSLDQVEWENFYAGIEGFEFIEGESALLKVKTTQIKNPPADMSNIHYELLEKIVVMPSVDRAHYDQNRDKYKGITKISGIRRDEIGLSGMKYFNSVEEISPEVFNASGLFLLAE